MEGHRDAMKNTIRAALGRIERNEGVKVLLAVESGSRAWGFASTDSDWDVRFIYLRRPEWYLSIQRRRDVLEFPLSESLDVSGWDLRKALGLFAKSNPPLFEWLRSPMVYREAYSTMASLRRMSAAFFSSRSCLHHYLHMAQGNFREYLQGPRVRTKKYFYVLRPILACRWIEAHRSMPPMEFAKLVDDRLPERLRPIVSDLLRRKRAGEELADGPRIPDINGFVEREISRLNNEMPPKAARHPVDWETLDAVFRESLDEVWKTA
ncbi:MAG: nucleotidyltransferase domain-containing protein [Elusimicrobia bacterium]|nr:nucleotidyltransferase domain-containing protein [Elusimicrobiota bacterium]